MPYIGCQNPCGKCCIAPRFITENYKLSRKPTYETNFMPAYSYRLILILFHSNHKKIPGTQNI
ncbi:hypothetical protein BpHYR1_042492 [Brachionus plicatilis]|uniref:Uncharacterized protein n=1 Tax=Brachionus plicatilis TaxID=10195 RepID=A0A3M7SWY8_BRAPC|nr:hypothetical protein BpHYR1_042492 [Brachionus plicatilis]